MPFAIALDLGTTSIKAALLDDNCSLQHLTSRHAPAIASNGGRFESDALAYAEMAEGVLAECLSHSDSRPPLGMCSQRSSFLIWERVSGKPVTPLISWQDDRGATACTTLREHDPTIHLLTGLRLTPYYLAPKLHVLLQQYPHWRASLECGDWLVGTLDTFLIWRWTDGAQHVTDASMAARTLLMDIAQAQWSSELGKLFNIPLSILPRIVSSVGMALPLNNGLTLQVSLGDQSAAFLASIGNVSDVLVNLGTGGFVMRSLPDVTLPTGGYLRTLLYQDEGTHLAIEGTINSITAALAPYPAKQCHVDDLAANDIFCLAEPSGIGAPYFRGDLGITFSQPVDQLVPSQIAALLLEAIIFRVARIVEEFNNIAPIKYVYLSGGKSKLPALQQGIAQCIAGEVRLLAEKDASLLGAAWLACGKVTPKSDNGEQMVAVSNPRLLTKYRAWKNWLDQFLR